MLKAVIFDMDGLLIDSEPIWRAVEIDLFATVGINLNDELCAQTAGWRLDHVIEHWYQTAPWQNKTKSALQKEIYDAMENAISTQAAPMLGALEAIKHVKAKGLKTGLASSSPFQLINAMLKRFSIETDFDALHSAQDEKLGKPDPAVYISTANKLGLAPDACLAVEDSAAGVQSAKGAGMLVCAVPDRQADLTQFMEADLIIDSLKSFPRSLERIID